MSDHITVLTGWNLDNVWDTNHNGANEYVFNTEAHPFKVAGPSI
jgi:hypothetical protein